MFETETRARTVIPEAIMLGRLAQSEQMREFFIQMWLQNPALARQGGAKVQSLMMPAVEAGTGYVYGSNMTKLLCGCAE